MKKALRWLEDHDVAFTFHDYKKDGLDKDALQTALDVHGWENVINRRGTTWRKLPQSTQDSMNNDNAVTLARENASIIKRPLLLHNGQCHLGFKADMYHELFG